MTDFNQHYRTTRAWIAGLTPILSRVGRLPVGLCFAVTLSCGDDPGTDSMPPSGGSTVGTGGVALASGGSGGGGPSSGGYATGGTNSTGGAFGSGGQSSGGGGTGGALFTGGTSPGGAGGMMSGGGPASGGMSGSGGLPGSGGMPGSGGGTADDDLCSAGVSDGSPSQVLQLTGNTFAHDPTMVKVGGTYYRFWTGPDLPMAKSDNLTHWTDGSPVFDRGYSAWVDPWLDGVDGETFNFPWAPDVSSFGGQVHLYSSFSARFGDNVSCITHLSTDNIEAGDWTDHGPVICTEGDESYNAIDADVGLDQDGTPWFSFGSFWDGIMAFELNPDGSRKGDDLTHLAWKNEIEAPVFLRRCGYYYLFVTWGLCCPGEGRSVNQLTYRVAVGRSENILGPYVDKNGVAMTDGGGTLIVEGDGVNWAAAGHSDVIVDGDAIYHLYHAYAQTNGNASLRIAELLFDADGWPVPHPP